MTESPSVKVRQALSYGLAQLERLSGGMITVGRADGRLLGIVPKTYLPNYREYYEKRWFASGIGLDGLTANYAGQSVPFGSVAPTPKSQAPSMPAK